VGSLEGGVPEGMIPRVFLNLRKMHEYRNLPFWLSKLKRHFCKCPIYIIIFLTLFHSVSN
jgi:hypothetical protein